MLAAAARAAKAAVAAGLLAAGTAGCASGGSPQMAPVTVMMPTAPAADKRLADLAAMDPNSCRARTPGFEALGGWLKNDGREPGESRVWITDNGTPADLGSHGGEVWRTFNGCAVRSDEGRYFDLGSVDPTDLPARFQASDRRDAIWSESIGPLFDDSVPLPGPGVWAEPGAAERFDANGFWIPTLSTVHDGHREGLRLLKVVSAGNDAGKRTSHLQDGGIQLAVREWEKALMIVVGGYTGRGDDRAVAHYVIPVENHAIGSSVCGDAMALCLFGPWETGGGVAGTSHAAPQVAAALDAVWAIWPDMDILDLRNLAFDCAEDMPAGAAGGGGATVERAYSYSNGRSFTAKMNSTWGHGVLSLACLFTPNGGLENPVTGEAFSGGIYGPLGGPVAGAAITGFDYTGRSFDYGFARPSARENFALAAIADMRHMRPAQAFAPQGNRAFFAGAGGYAAPSARGRLWRRGALRVDLTAAGNAIGAAAQWQAGGMTIRGGIATQPEGAGSLAGSRAFRAPVTLSATVAAAYEKALGQGFAVHLKADYWRTLAARGRSLWNNAQLRESRLAAALVRRAGRHEFVVRAAWQSGLVGSLDVDGLNWAVAGAPRKGLWLTWRQVY